MFIAGLFMNATIRSTLWFNTFISADIDECALGGKIYTCTDPRKVCANTIGSWTCMCQSEYTMDEKGICNPFGKRVKMILILGFIYISWYPSYTFIGLVYYVETLTWI